MTSRVPMETKPDSQESIVEQLIKPAIFKLAEESDGCYHSEADCRYHFILCIGRQSNLELGTLRRRVYTEYPTRACYGTRRGNLDFFFLGGVAVEVNCGYCDGYRKIVQDVQKLIDPVAAYRESVYFAYCRRRRLFPEVVRGVNKAFDYFAEDRPDFKLPTGLHIFVVEYTRNLGHTIRDTRVREACTPSELQWSETTVKQTDAAIESGNTHSLGQFQAIPIRM